MENGKWKMTRPFLLRSDLDVVDSLHVPAAVAERMRHRSSKPVDAGSIPAGSFGRLAEAD